VSFVLGKKVGMTRVFDSEGKAVAVSVISVVPTKVKRIINYRENLKSVQIEVSQNKKDAPKNKPANRYEFRIKKEEEYKVGQDINANNLLKTEFVDISGPSKGKGFTGVIKRYGFSRGPETHGSHHHRSTGSIGGAYPQRVIKGRKMPGRMGGTFTTVKNLKVFDVDKEQGIILVAGAIPGAKKSLIKVISK